MQSNNNLCNFTGHSSTAEDASKLKPNGPEILRPSKLGIQQKSPVQIFTTPTTTSYIRPSTFSYTNVNSNMNQQKIAVRKDLGHHMLEQLHVNNKPTTQLSLDPKIARVKVKLGAFAANIENPFSSKSKNEHVLMAKPATATEVRPSVLFHEAFRPAPLLEIPQRKPIVASKLKILQPGLALASSTLKHRILPPHSLPTNSIKAATVLRLPPRPDPPKAQPTATITSSSMPIKMVNLGMYIFCIFNC